MKVRNNCNLRQCFLCRHCLPAWLPAVAGHRKVQHFAKGETVFGEGDAVTGMYFVYEGLVKVHKQWGTGKELILRFARQGDLLGHRGLGAEGIYPISATALEPSVICFVPLPFFYDTLRVNPDLTFTLLDFFAAELRLSEQKMRNLAHMPVKGRVAQALLLLRSQFGTDPSGALRVALSRQDFAAYAGTVYETAFRMLNELAEEACIRMEKKAIIILDAGRMAQYSRPDGAAGEEA